MTHLKINQRFAKPVPYGFNSILDELLEGSKVEKQHQYDFSPKANIIENDAQFEIQLELAGYNRNDVEVVAEKGIVTIKGEKQNKSTDNSVKYHLKQYSTGNFSRSFTLPEDILEEKIVAKFNNGILKLQIPKDEAKPSKRLVKIG